jgi:N,N'-diacetyllegionaminate synthase
VPYQLLIGNRTIGEGHRAYVIAEAGVNHNGDLELAKQLVARAKEAGADCVKFQTFRADRIVTRAAPKAAYQLATTDPSESQRAMLQRLELTRDAHHELAQACERYGIDLLSTPYSSEDIELLEDVGVQAYKVPSALLVEPAFLRDVARPGKPIIASTGMATLGEVDEAVRTIREAGCESIALLQCTTNYPSQTSDANVRAMVTMRDAFGVVVGYSDHTQTDNACLAAVALGAAIVEKHFTLDRKLAGPDHCSSAEPADLARLVRSIREVEAALGTGAKSPCPAETRNRTAMRRSIVARQDIARGSVLTAGMLTFKRPATGLPPGRLGEVVGRVALEDIPADALIQWEMCGSKA